MTTRTTPRAHGAFTWLDLSTPELEGAKRFYRHVFNWDYLDMGPEFGHYHYALVQGRAAAGLGQLPPTAPMSPAWTVYLASMAGDVERVKALGGQVVVETMTVGDAGKMTVCADPGGAVFGLWQPISFIGAAVEGEPGGLAWCEVNTRNAAAACKFYGDLFGLTPHKLADQEYFIMQRGEEMVFGVLQMDEQWGDLPPHWMGYFAIDNTDAALARVVAAGGTVGVPALDTPYGRIAAINDPYGATVSIVQLPTQ
jgi:predicted enzyme related to lactoylglutathione lyase